MFRILSLMLSVIPLSEWQEVQSDVDNGNLTPDLTNLFIILAIIVVALATAYVIARLAINAKREKETLEREMRAGIPHIKALDNNLPGSSLSSLYKENGKTGSRKE